MNCPLTIGFGHVEFHKVGI